MRTLTRRIVPVASVASMLLFTESAFSQCSSLIPNAVGIWRSDNFDFTNFTIPVPPYLAATPGYRAWQVLPAELCTYYRCGTGKRELDFRGIEFNVVYNNPIPLAFDTPDILITDQLVPVAPPVTTRVGPAPLAVGLTFLGAPNAIPGGLAGAGLVHRLSYIKAGAPFVVSPGSMGVAAVWLNYEMQFGHGSSLEFVATTTEPVGTFTDADNSFSGYSVPPALTPVTWPNFIFGGSPCSGEFCITWLFDQSMIQPVRNAKMVGGVIPPALGGGVYPPGFHFTFDDGRGSIISTAGDTISYNGNSSRGYPATAAGAPSCNTWLVPFVMFEGDVIGLPFTDPPPELWLTGPSYIYKQSVADWVDDAIVLFGGAPGLGVALDVNKCYLGLWLGIDLAPLLNITMFINSITFADVSSPQWAGPSVCVYDSIKNPAGLISRNLINSAGSPYDPASVPLVFREHRTLVNAPQSGYTPIMPIAGAPPGSVGFGTVPPLALGLSFGIQCWVFDSGQVIDVTNVAITRFQ